MKTLVVLATVLALAAAKPTIKNVSTGTCGDSNQAGTITELSASPYPIVVQSGATVTLNAALTLNTEISVGSQLSLDMSKVSPIPFPIPCLNIDGLMLGSCTGQLIRLPVCSTYDGTDFLNHLPADGCAQYFPGGCVLPLITGNYGGDPPLVLNIPDLPDIILALISTGRYRVEALVTDSSGTQEACLFAEFDITH